MLLRYFKITVQRFSAIGFYVYVDADIPIKIIVRWMEAFIGAGLYAVGSLWRHDPLLQGCQVDAGQDFFTESTYVNGRENGTLRTFSDNYKRESFLEADFVNDRRTEIRYYKRGKLIRRVVDDPNSPQDRVRGRGSEERKW